MSGTSGLRAKVSVGCKCLHRVAGLAWDMLYDPRYAAQVDVIPRSWDTSCGASHRLAVVVAQVVYT